MSVDERFIELESRLTFQEEAIQSLSDLVYAQQKQPDSMQLSMDLLNQWLRETSHGEPDKVIDEPPPHY